MKMLAPLLALALPPSVHPWPIGAGPRYTPPARPAAVSAGAPVSGLRCSAPGASFPIHVELFANRKVVILPAGIGVAGRLSASSPLVPAGCVYPVHTIAPDGVVEVARGSTLHLADLFRLWRQPLRGHRLASFSSLAPVRAYVGGKLVRGPAAAVALTPQAEIVIELGGYVPPHPFFLFAGGHS